MVDNTQRRAYNTPQSAKPVRFTGRQRKDFCMSMVSRTASGVSQILHHRLFAASLLALASVAMVTYVSINIRAVTVYDGGTTRVVMSLSDDPASILESANIRLQENDTYVSRLSDEEGVISINRAFDVSVLADGITTVLRLNGGTVGEALQAAGIALDADDAVSVATESMVYDGLHIAVDRVDYEEYTVTESIPYETTLRYTNTLAVGKQISYQSGQPGERTLRYRNRVVNGEVVETELVSDEVTVEPVQAITLTGCTSGTPMSPAPYEILLDEAGQPVQYQQMFTGKATAYTNDRGLLSEYTATGRRAAVGVVAVDPNLIPYGTELYIVSPDGSYVYGYAIAGDTGGGVRSGKLITDLFMNTYEECVQFGKRTMNVYILG